MLRGASQEASETTARPAPYRLKEAEMRKRTETTSDAAQILAAVRGESLPYNAAGATYQFAVHARETAAEGAARAVPTVLPEWGVTLAASEHLT